MSIDAVCSHDNTKFYESPVLRRRKNGLYELRPWGRNATSLTKFEPRSSPIVREIMKFGPNKGEKTTHAAGVAHLPGHLPGGLHRAGCRAPLLGAQGRGHRHRHHAHGRARLLPLRLLGEQAALRARRLWCALRQWGTSIVRLQRPTTTPSRSCAWSCPRTRRPSSQSPRR